MEFPVEVLFEYKESKRKLGVTPRSVCAILTQELARFGKEGAVVQLAKPQSSRVTVQPAGQYHSHPRSHEDAEPSLCSHDWKGELVEP